MAAQLVLGLIVVAFTLLYVWYRSTIQPPEGRPEGRPGATGSGAPLPLLADAFAPARAVPGVVARVRAAAPPAWVAGLPDPPDGPSWRAAVRAELEAQGGPLQVGPAPWVVLVVGSDAAVGAVAAHARSAGRSVLVASPASAGFPLDPADPVGGARRAVGAAMARAVDVLVLAPFVGEPDDTRLAEVCAAAGGVWAGAPHEVLVERSDPAAGIPSATTGLFLDHPVGPGLLGIRAGAPVRWVRLGGGWVPWDAEAFTAAWLDPA